MLLAAFTFIFISVALSSYLILSKYDKKTQEDKEEGDIWSYLDKLIEEKTFMQRTMIELQRAGLKLRFSEYIMLYVYSYITSAIIGFMITHSIISLMTIGLIGLFIPLMFVKSRQASRLKKINKQLPDLLVLMSNSLKAGYSFMQSLDLIAHDGHEPIKGEFNRVVKETNLGYPIEQSLNDLVDRVDSEDLDLAVVVIKIQRQIGGNLSEILDKIVHTIRDRVRINGEINTLTAQGKMQGLILTLLIPIVCVIMYILNPNFIDPLFSTTLGITMLVTAGILNIIGIVLIIKIVRIEV